ncbi:DUF3089 domain-containing protein [Embleya sp. NPDC056575]|uniref:DUF3089 domain-containing protein n=1 Tax=unclassified Embleya TaxID=2699296 RepID=UPI0036ACE107
MSRSRILLALGALSLTLAAAVIPTGTSAAPNSTPNSATNIAANAVTNTATNIPANTTSTADPAGKSLTSPLKETVWLCRPGLATNPCNQDLAGNPQRPGPDGTFSARYLNGATTTLDATSVRADGSRVPEPFAAPANPQIDCFYAYPTVDLLPNPLLRIGSLPPSPSNSALAAALDQIGRFAGTCRVFAPMYRQASFSELLVGGLGVPLDAETGSRDVLDAWRDYWANHNTDPVTHQRRGVVLLGHSQGTGVLSRVMQQEIDGNPAVQDRLVSAVLLGGYLQVPIGGTQGGGADPASTFQHIPTCVRSGPQAPIPTGCVVAYNSYALPPGGALPAGSAFGRTPIPGHRMMCVNPAALLRGTPADTATPLDMYMPTRRLMDGNWLNPRGHLAHVLSAYELADDPSGYTRYQDKISGKCAFTQDANGTATWFDITGGAGMFPDSGLSVPLGTHTVDYNVAMGDLTALIAAQANTWRAAHPA